jgi:hypothetical protein
MENLNDTNNINAELQRTYNEFLKECKKGELWMDKNKRSFEITKKTGAAGACVHIITLEDAKVERLFSVVYPRIKNAAMLFCKNLDFLKLREKKTPENAKEERQIFTFYNTPKQNDIYTVEVTIELFNKDEINTIQNAGNSFDEDLLHIKRKYLYVNIEKFNNDNEDLEAQRCRKKICVREDNMCNIQINKFKEINDFLMSGSLRDLLANFNIVVLNLPTDNNKFRDDKNDSSSNHNFNDTIIQDQIMKGVEFNITLDKRLYQTAMLYGKSFPILFVKNMRFDFRYEKPQHEVVLEKQIKNVSNKDSATAVDSVLLDAKLELLKGIFATDKIPLKKLFFETDLDLESSIEKKIRKEMMEDAEDILNMFHVMLHNSQDFNQHHLLVENAGEILRQNTNTVIRLIQNINEQEEDHHEHVLDKSRGSSEISNISSCSSDENDFDDSDYQNENTIMFIRKEWEEQKGFTEKQYNEVMDTIDLYI